MRFGCLLSVPPSELTFLKLSLLLRGMGGLAVVWLECRGPRTRACAWQRGPSDLDTLAAGPQKAEVVLNGTGGCPPARAPALS